MIRRPFESGQKRKQYLFQITSELNSHLQNPISTRTLQRKLHASDIYRRIAIRKPRVTSHYVFQRHQWCKTQKIGLLNSIQKATGLINHSLPYFRPLNLFMREESPLKHFLMTVTCQPWRMEVVPFCVRYVGVALGCLLMYMRRSRLTMSIFWESGAFLTRHYFHKNDYFIRTILFLKCTSKKGLKSTRSKCNILLGLLRLTHFFHYLSSKI